MRNLFIAYMLPNGGNGNAIIDGVEDDFEIVSIKSLRGIRDIVFDYVNHEDFPYKKEEIVIINWKWLPDHPPKETAEEIDRYKKALQEISELPGHRQDEGCNIALNALDY